MSTRTAKTHASEARAGAARGVWMWLALTAAITASCTNSSMTLTSSSQQLATTASTLASPTPGDNYTIANIVAGTSTSGSAAEMQIFIDANSTAAASESIDAHCVPGSSDCVCQFKWVELNPNSTSTVQIPRSVQTTVDLTQTNLVQCPEPSVWNTDIPNGTTVSISIAPAVSGSQNFTTTVYSYVFGSTSTTTASGGGYAYTDSTGIGFENVSHYTCFDTTTRGLGIKSQVVQVSNGSTDSAALATAYAPLASAVCSISSDGSTPAGCTLTSLTGGPTAQSSYYNLYNIDGNFNVSNGRFYCPQVTESLTRTGSIGSQNQLWPLDATFSLAQSSSATYPVGVEAFTKLSNPGDPPSNASTCFAAENPDGTAASSSSSGGTDTPSTNGSLTQACLGFAALPNPDGSCPTIKDSSGNVSAMFRLRRYSIVYPELFEANGGPLAGGVPADTIYVLDRPVSAPNADPIVKPDTMLGPKPCPYAYYDRTGETSTQSPTAPQYTATNDAGQDRGVANFTGWTGKDVDGNQFPNTDAGAPPGQPAGLSCSSVIALPDYASQTLSLATVNAANYNYKQLYVRPITAWTPHYEEDTSFRACAPSARPLRDPPLHFARMPDGNIAYCAEVYPTQNPNITAIDPSLTGRVPPFTSHTSKNAFDANNLAIPPCMASTTTLSIPSAYPGGGWARHPASTPLKSFELDSGLTTTAATCDRTVTSSNAIPNPTFPLLAPPSMVEQALQADPDYMCQMTYDNTTGATSKAGVASPSQGCCGPAVRVYTGLPGPAGFSFNNAHLEPNPNVGTSTNCQTPGY